MVEYWNCGKLPFPDIEEFVDQNVGEALKQYIEKDGMLMIDFDGPEPYVEFSTEGEFTYKQSLFNLLVFGLGNLRPGGPDDADIFYDPEGDRSVILLQALVHTFLKWKRDNPDVSQAQTPVEPD